MRSAHRAISVRALVHYLRSVHPGQKLDQLDKYNVHHVLVVITALTMEALLATGVHLVIVVRMQQHYRQSAIQVLTAQVDKFGVIHAHGALNH